jgi:hypothetical protein
MTLSFVVATRGCVAVGRPLGEAQSLSTTLKLSAKNALWARDLGGHPARPLETQADTRRRRQGP